MASAIEQKIKTLQDYSACDVSIASLELWKSTDETYQVSDALLKIQKLPPGTTARAGYLADFGTIPTTTNHDQLSSMT